MSAANSTKYFPLLPNDINKNKLHTLKISFKTLLFFFFLVYKHIFIYFGQKILVEIVRFLTACKKKLLLLVIPHLISSCSPLYAPDK